MPSRWRNPLRACAVAACVWAGGACAQTPAATRYVVPRIEHSDVTINGNDGNWDVWSVTAGRTNGPGRWVEGSAARQKRNSLADDEFRMAGGERFGAWDATAAVHVAPNAHFLAEWGYDLGIDHAAGVNRRAGVGYQRLLFKDSSVNLASAHMNFYRGDDEFGIEYRFGRNPQLDHDIRVLQLRGSILRGRNQFAAYLSKGDYLFDALGIPGGSGAGWSANLAYARTLTPSTKVRLELGSGSETDTFRQHLIAVSLQYSP